MGPTPAALLAHPAASFSAPVALLLLGPAILFSAPAVQISTGRMGAGNDKKTKIFLHFVYYIFKKGGGG